MEVNKIIYGRVGPRGTYTEGMITEEDYGILFQMPDLDLPAAYQVDFSNKLASGTALTVVGNSDGALIPQSLMDSGKDVYAFMYYVGDGFGKTTHVFRINNNRRAKRGTPAPTPTQQSVIDQAISALNSAVAQTAQDVIDADASAQSASQSAENAHDSAVDAQNYAETAQTSATQASASASQASASATASAQSASQSAQIKADVEDLADDAQRYANASEQSATASANSASQAQGYAQSASASAQSASGYASQADMSANTASNKASEASTSASTASQKATEASQSASQALSYKTDAESAKTASQTAQGLAESARDNAVSAKTDAESARDDAETARDEAQQAVASISGALDDKAPVITDTASGSIASFTDGADNLPLKSLIVDINPIQDLHGQENPYPAGGGVNLLEIPDSEPRTANGVTWHFENGLLYINGTATGGTVMFTANVDFAEDTYTFSAQLISGSMAGSNSSFNGYTSNNDRRWLCAFGNFGKTISLTQTGDIARISANFNNASVFNDAVIGFQVERGSSMTEWSPYENLCPISGWTQIDVNHSGADMTNPTTLTIQLGQTVYGGKLDVLTGELVIDRAMVDLGTLEWGYSGTMFFSTSAPFFGDGGSALVYSAKNVCEIYENAPIMLSNPINGRFYVSNTQNLPVLRVSDNRFTDAPSLKTALNGVKAVFELATPITIQLTSNQLNSLYGVNNLWADSGDTEVEYRADTKLYIAKKIAEAIASLT